MDEARKDDAAAGRPPAAEPCASEPASADRLAPVRTLVAGIAHELNNPLACVTANLSFVSERLERLAAVTARTPEDDLVRPLADAIADARAGAERMRVVVRDLRTFSRPDEEPLRPVALAPILDSCLAMAASEIGRRARLERRFDPVPPVRGTEGRLGQVFLNLLVNAAQAIPDGAPDAHVVAVATRLAPDGRVAVEIRDTGCGIAPRHLERIFDPFFTTKPPGSGAGLGLSIALAIVTALDGEITVESVPAAGATFRVLLPPADAPRPAPPAPQPRRGRILVVDDEPLVCQVLARTLGTDHDVVTVERAAAGLALLERGERFDLVLSDLLMPEMTGMELHRELSARWPQLARRTVFLTGGAFTEAARAFVERGVGEFVEKPFDLQTIRALVARKLAL